MNAVSISLVTSISGSRLSFAIKNNDKLVPVRNPRLLSVRDPCFLTPRMGIHFLKNYLCLRAGANDSVL